MEFYLIKRTSDRKTLYFSYSEQECLDWLKDNNTMNEYYMEKPELLGYVPLPEINNGK